MRSIAVAALLLGLAFDATAQVAVVRVDPLGEYPSDGLVRFGHDDLGAGSVGMSYGEGAWPSTRTIFLDDLALSGHVGPEAVTTYVGTMFDAELVVDGSGAPHVLVDYRTYDGSNHRQVREYVRGPGGWSSALAFELPDSNAVLVASALGPGDTLHAVMCLGSSAQLYYASTTGGAWQWEAIPQESDVSYATSVRLAVDSGGHAHLVYDLYNDASNPPQRPELRYLTNASGSWQREVVFAEGNTGWSLHVDPSIALDGNGAPLVASTYGETASSGSLLYSELRLNRRLGASSWSSEVVASSSDNFAAGDGPQYTGWSPVLLLDGEDRARLFFSDMACWHDAVSQRCQRGQVRLAASDSGGWALTTLYPQSVNTQSYLHRLRIDAVVASLAADSLSVLGYEGSPANAGWTGTFAHLRVLVSEALLFVDGFESGDATAWSAAQP